MADERSAAALAQLRARCELMPGTMAWWALFGSSLGVLMVAQDQDTRGGDLRRRSQQLESSAGFASVCSPRSHMSAPILHSCSERLLTDYTFRR
jgi:hypothetical protein